MHMHPFYMPDSTNVNILDSSMEVVQQRTSNLFFPVSFSFLRLTIGVTLAD